MGGPKVGVAPGKKGKFGQTPSSRLSGVFLDFFSCQKWGHWEGRSGDNTEDTVCLLTVLQSLQCSVELLPLL